MPLPSILAIVLALSFAATLPAAPKDVAELFPGNSLAFIGYNFTHYFSDPSVDNRGVHRAVVGVAHQFKPQLTGQIFYAYEFSDYEDVDRHDSRHVVAANMVYQFNRHLFGNVGGSFIDNDSTQDRASYQAVVGSLGLTWQF